MVKEMYLNDTLLKLNRYKEERIENLIQISIDFLVTSDEYHEVTTLLYENNFHVNVPENELTFQAMINKYSTSITNLYEKGQVATFSLSLLEVKE